MHIHMHIHMHIYMHICFESQAPQGQGDRRNAITVSFLSRTVKHQSKTHRDLHM